MGRGTTTLQWHIAYVLPQVLGISLVLLIPIHVGARYLNTSLLQLCSPGVDDRTLLYDMTPGFKPFTMFVLHYMKYKHVN